MQFLEKFFKIKENNSSFKTEILAGIATFFAMSYLIFVCPDMIATATQEAGSPDYEKIRNAVFIATCLSAFVGTMFMGLIAKIPFAQASGMGLIGFFAYSIILSMGYTYAEALVFVFISGILFIIITIAGIREHIIRAIPRNIKIAISGGIGLFIAYLGLRNAGIVVNSNATGVTMVDFSKIFNPATEQATRNMIIGAGIAGIGVLIIVILNHFKLKGSILIAIASCTIIGIPFGLVKLPTNVFTNFSTNFTTQWNDYFEVGFLSVIKGFESIFGGKDIISSILLIFMIVLTFSLVNLFDSIGTFLGTAGKANLLDKDGNMQGMRKALLCDALGTTVGALLGSSTVTTTVESSVGIGEGGRTGFTSVITALLFLLAIPLWPLVKIVPGFATAPALIFVGVLMLSGIKSLDFDNITELFPAFLTIAIMPFTASIANGIAFGMISHTFIKLITAKGKDLHPLTIVLSILFIARFLLLSV